MKPQRVAFIAALALCACAHAQSQPILKCTDSAGRITYTNGECDAKQKPRQVAAPILGVARSTKLSNAPLPASSQPIQSQAKTPPIPPKSDADQKYDEAVAALERQHPPLNPDSPAYDARLVAKVLERKAKYMEGGYSPANAIQAAVADSVPPEMPVAERAPLRRWDWMSPGEQMLEVLPSALLNSFAKSLLFLPLVLFIVWLLRRLFSGARRATRVVRKTSAVAIAKAAGNATARMEQRASEVAGAYRDGRRDAR